MLIQKMSKTGFRDRKLKKTGKKTGKQDEPQENRKNRKKVSVQTL